MYFAQFKVVGTINYIPSSFHLLILATAVEIPSKDITPVFTILLPPKSKHFLLNKE